MSRRRTDELAVFAVEIATGALIYAAVLTLILLFVFDVL